MACLVSIAVSFGRKKLITRDFFAANDTYEEITRTLWLDGQPSYFTEPECIVMQRYPGKEYFWRNANCAENYRYLCEVGMLPYIFYVIVHREIVL